MKAKNSKSQTVSGLNKIFVQFHFTDTKKKKTNCKNKRKIIRDE